MVEQCIYENLIEEDNIHIESFSDAESVTSISNQNYEDKNDFEIKSKYVKSFIKTFIIMIIYGISLSLCIYAFESSNLSYTFDENEVFMFHEY
jgi:hypothetical protein